MFVDISVEDSGVNEYYPRSALVLALLFWVTKVRHLMPLEQQM